MVGNISLYIHHICFINLSVNGHVGYFNVLAVNNAEMSMEMQIPLLR